MKNTALVTGASSGIGRELARLHASKGGDLFLVARRLTALEELKEELESTHGVEVRCLSADLGDPEGPRRVYQEIVSAEIEIDVLINNAGFGGHGKFHERAWEEDRAMIQLNVIALCELTHLVLQGMTERRKGKILNVASTAGFLPGPLQAVYYATKSFVVSFSQAIAEELTDEDITVTALCPGPVSTGFIDRAGVGDVGTFQNAASPESVAAVGYRAMERGKLIAINDWRFSMMVNWVAPFVPRRTLLRMSRASMEKGK